MTAPDERDDVAPPLLFIRPASVAAIVAAMLPGAIQAWRPEAPTRSMVAVALIALSSLTATVALGWVERRARRAVPVVLGLLALELTVAVMVSQGRASLAMMPLIGMCVMYLPLPVALACDVGLASLVLGAWALGGLRGRALWHESFGSLSAAGFVVAFSFIVLREQRSRAEVERLSARLARLAATQERTRIARELHDSLGHHLTIALVQLEAARSTPADLDARLARVATALKSGLGDLRHSLQVLREQPPSAHPWVASVHELAETARHSGLTATVEIIGIERPLPALAGFALYRVVQEGLTNVARHARASRVTIRLEFVDSRVRVSLEDDGVGSANAEGYGLRGLRERVEALGGSFEAGPGDPRGFRVVAEVKG